jgi:hypothetical protein
MVKTFVYIYFNALTVKGRASIPVYFSMYVDTVLPNDD